VLGMRNGTSQSLFRPAFGDSLKPWCIPTLSKEVAGMASTKFCAVSTKEASDALGRKFKYPEKKQ